MSYFVLLKNASLKIFIVVVLLLAFVQFKIAHLVCISIIQTRLQIALIIILYKIPALYNIPWNSFFVIVKIVAADVEPNTYANLSGGISSWSWFYSLSVCYMSFSLNELLWQTSWSRKFWEQLSSNSCELRGYLKSILITSEEHSVGSPIINREREK